MSHAPNIIQGLLADMNSLEPLSVFIGFWPKNFDLKAQLLTQLL
jgi:hypothetical protein